MKARMLFVLVIAMLGVGPVWARDSVLHLPADLVLDESYSGGDLDGSVRFYLSGQRTPAVLETLGEAITNRKTNGVGKSDEESCQWVMLSALVALQQAAKARGANAVIGITSYYKKREYSDPEKFECHAGNIMSGVALRGTYAKVADR